MIFCAYLFNLCPGLVPTEEEKYAAAELIDDDVEGNKGEEGFDDEETAIDCDEQSEDSNDDDENEENSNRKGDVDDGNPLL